MGATKMNTIQRLNQVIDECEKTTHPAYVEPLWVILEKTHDELNAFRPHDIWNGLRDARKSTPLPIVTDQLRRLADFWVLVLTNTKGGMTKEDEEHFKSIATELSRRR